jgi:hypothetical protein
VTDLAAILPHERDAMRGRVLDWERGQRPPVPQAWAMHPRVGCGHTSDGDGNGCDTSWEMADECWRTHAGLWPRRRRVTDWRLAYQDYWRPYWRRPRETRADFAEIAEIGRASLTFSFDSPGGDVDGLFRMLTAQSTEAEPDSPDCGSAPPGSPSR